MDSVGELGYGEWRVDECCTQPGYVEVNIVEIDNAGSHESWFNLPAEYALQLGSAIIAKATELIEGGGRGA